MKVKGKIYQTNREYIRDGTVIPLSIFALTDEEIVGLDTFEGIVIGGSRPNMIGDHSKDYLAHCFEEMYDPDLIDPVFRKFFLCQ